jgi:hypothetical protein
MPNPQVAVKTAGRGSHVTLGFEGNTFTRSSKCAAWFWGGLWWGPIWAYQDRC